MPHRHIFPSEVTLLALLIIDIGLPQTHVHSLWSRLLSNKKEIHFSVSDTKAMNSIKFGVECLLAMMRHLFNLVEHWHAFCHNVDIIPICNISIRQSSIRCIYSGAIALCIVRIRNDCEWFWISLTILVGAYSFNRIRTDFHNLHSDWHVSHLQVHIINYSGCCCICHRWEEGKLRERWHLQMNGKSKLREHCKVTALKHSRWHIDSCLGGHHSISRGGGWNKSFRADPVK